MFGPWKILQVHLAYVLPQCSKNRPYSFHSIWVLGIFLWPLSLLLDPVSGQGLEYMNKCLCYPHFCLHTHTHTQVRARNIWTYICAKPLLPTHTHTHIYTWEASKSLYKNRIENHRFFWCRNLKNPFIQRIFLTIMKKTDYEMTMPGSQKKLSFPYEPIFELCFLTSLWFTCRWHLQP